jgi:hypothetical protein
MRTTAINGTMYLFLECDNRFERLAEVEQKYGNAPGFDRMGAELAVNQTCKRVGLLPKSAKWETGLWVQHVRNGEENAYTFGDASVATDTDGEDWLQTDAGLHCPLCLAQERDMLRLLVTKGINPFTGAAFAPNALDDEEMDRNFAENAEGFGRELRCG